MSGSTELKAYITCSFILYLKFVITAGIQATKTFDAGCRPPEDKNLALAQGRREQNYGLFNDTDDAELMKAREVEHRWKRIIQNDLESIPLALLVFLGGRVRRRQQGTLRRVFSDLHARALLPHVCLRQLAAAPPRVVLAHGRARDHRLRRQLYRRRLQLGWTAA
ncbi:hypothetical protein KRP22_002729 [Phytophthora ramorum]|nr:hypothetical protein KRP22_6376 [Phytophthora ramorum]